MRLVLRTCGELLVGTLSPLAAALLLIPAGRVAAWAGLLAVAAAVSWFVGRDCGIVAAVSAGLAFMWVHGPDRFAGRLSDSWIIRYGLLLWVVGVAAVAAADLWHRRARELHATPLVADRRRPR